MSQEHGEANIDFRKKALTSSQWLKEQAGKESCQVSGAEALHAIGVRHHSLPNPWRSRLLPFESLLTSG